MKQQIQFDSEAQERVITKDNQQFRQLVKISKVRPEVLERQKWPKWGEVKDIERGVHREGDMLLEVELRIQVANNQEELNFVIPVPKTKFVVDFTPEQKQVKEQTVRQIGGQISFPTGEGFSSQQQWLLIVSNLVQFEFANTFVDIIQIKDHFRAWLAKHLDQSEGRFTYFINFLQNKRKPKITSDDKQVALFPLIQKVMLKFQDRSQAEIAHDKLMGKNYDGSVLCLELQEQRAR